MGTFHSKRSQSLSTLTSWAAIPHGLTGKTNEASFRILAYGDNILRITATREEHVEDFSYSVVSQASGNAFSVLEKETTLLLEGPSFNLVIAKNPVRFSFQTKEGKVINEDDTFGISWNREQVTSYKKLQEGERFIGSGGKNRTVGSQRPGLPHIGIRTTSHTIRGLIPCTALLLSTSAYIMAWSMVFFLDNTFKSFFNFRCLQQSLLQYFSRQR